MIYHSLGIMCEQDDFDYMVLFSAQQHIKPPEAPFTNMVISNTSMNKKAHVQWSVGWNYPPIPKF